MLINLLNYAISGIAFGIMLVAYVMQHYFVKDEWKGVFREITDSIPVLLLAYYWNPYAALFLIGCEVCNGFTSENEVIGMILYTFVYGSTGLFVCKDYWNQGVVPINIALLVASIGVIILILISLTVNISKKQPLTLIAGMPIFVILAHTPLLCAGMLTMNIGLFSLVIGDVLLCFARAFKGKTVTTISEAFFFLGEAITPIILMTL